jgi:hypothetical protein
MGEREDVSDRYYVADCRQEMQAPRMCQCADAGLWRASMTLRAVLRLSSRWSPWRSKKAQSG